MKLLYFTNAYPYGMSVLWKQQELETFRKYCDEITVIPFGFFGNSNPRNKVEGIRYREPLFPNQPYVSLKRRLLSVLFSRHIGLFLKQFLTGRVFLSRHHFINWILDSYTIILLSRHPLIKELLHSCDESTVWYFYWGRNTSLIIPLLKKRKFFVCCRLHGYDLYAERNRGYLPYQDEQVKHSDLLLPCSTHGNKYLTQKYSKVSNKIFTARLGARFRKLASVDNNGILKIVSCATVRPVKRIHILVEAMKHVTCTVSWVHVGAGELLDTLKENAAGIQRDNVRIKFTGSMPAREIPCFYVENCFDLFVNVSESEGVPVSIMEAFAAGIPVYATNVGGTGEIVNELVGKLLPADLTPQFLAQCLDQFATMPQEVKDEYRRNAIKRFKECCDADQNAELLIHEIRQRAGFPISRQVN